jgi:Flp pilus assembly protein TadB
VVSGYPLAIGSGFILVIALLSYSYVAELRKLIKKYSVAFQSDIDKADIAVKSEDYLMILAAIGALIWIGTIFLYRLPLVEELATLPLVISITAVLGVFYLRFRGAQRIKGFGDQFEMALRMMSGALRVGLGFRQAIILVTEEVPNPARRELLRVIGRANIGINILDALDELSRSVPSSETLMFARVVRVQQQRS